MLPRPVALNCLARTCCISAANTARSMQQPGLIFVLAPALRFLYPEHGARERAFARYGGHSNTHAFMIPLYAGILLSLETQIARGSLPESAVNSVRDTLATTLSALGDSFFSGTLRPLWALSSVSLLLSGHIVLTAVLTAALLLFLWLFRAITFFAGLRHGMPVLLKLRRLDLINWVDTIKMLNAALVALILWQLTPTSAMPFPWLAYGLATSALLAAAWLVGRMHLPRILLWALTLGMLILMDEGLIGM